MFATAIIVLREVLEAALVVSLVLAATRGLRRSRLWVASGVASGAAAAIVVAIFAGAIAAAAQGMGQEFFNAGVLFAAVAMLGWHNVWMAKHGKQLATEIKAVGHDVATGSRPQYVLATVVGLAVLREGAEVVLFLYGIAVSQQENALAMWFGGLLGFAAGAATGWLLYLGLLRLASRYVFKVTGWLISLLAAGMAAQGAGFLVQADVLPTFGDEPLWDTSSLVSQASVLGRLLQALVGYVDRPLGIQLVFYAVTLGAIMVLSRFYGVARVKPETAHSS